ncbi:hypothetical protein AWH56_026065 [Anaerobacillus isosaccharinicus]|uniref:CNNM transmembrane domain-containing protein n=1 Tax=Anaerobacillus isosaccharinicus TaxID=1532552 RepID=A0A1S2MEQ5_9BACI|nr:hypothetical protein [Anaerobacillus isosaccharinicus]MBA5585627.1 hypothetical protein [Anaerobacillus isosaccharinicus]QOY36064.1 hypothetical protein AWH56_026065 [Anaerobacillus isosaccharinicus]
MNKLKNSLNWTLGIAVITFVLAALFSIVSTFILSGVTWAVGMIIVLIIVLVGVIFDTIGVAATAAEEAPFHAMAAERVSGAKEAVLITKNADRFANFCNDVIGDIAGIISGTASAFVVIQLAQQIGQGENSAYQFWISVIFTSVVASLTVGGKALGKTLALHYATPIIFQVGRLFYLLEVKLKINILKNGKDREKRKKKAKRK